MRTSGPTLWADMRQIRPWSRSARGDPERLPGRFGTIPICMCISVARSARLLSPWGHQDASGNAGVNTRCEV